MDCANIFIFSLSRTQNVSTVALRDCSFFCLLYNYRWYNTTTCLTSTGAAPETICIGSVTHLRSVLYCVACCIALSYLVLCCIAYRKTAL